MDEQQKAAYVIAQAACAMIEAIGMSSDNSQHPMDQPHPKADFDDLILKYGIGHNDVLKTLRD